MSRRFCFATLSTLVVLLAAGPPATAAPKAHNTAKERLDVYTGVVDTRVVVNGVADGDGFEAETSDWMVAGAPAGSPENSGSWAIGAALLNFYAATSTDDTLLLGFGLEQLATDEDRRELLSRALAGLLGAGGTWPPPRGGGLCDFRPYVGRKREDP